MSKRNVYILLAVLVVIVGAFIYPRYFDWWDNENCTESGGTWNEEQDKCIEPRNADIPNTSPAPHDEGGAKPRE